MGQRVNLPTDLPAKPKKKEAGESLHINLLSELSTVYKTRNSLLVPRNQIPDYREQMSEDR